MGKYLTKKQAVAMFKEENSDFIKKETNTTVRCAWNDYTDHLCKDGQISQRQYETWGNPFSK